MIRDLEELLLSVEDDLSRDYLREAVRCYHAGAFRAAVVLAVAACMDDLFRKLVHLRTTGAGSDITRLANTIESKLKAHEAFEHQLLDGCQSADVLSPAEYGKLVTMLKTRHLCAHPSGHSGSAEEARDVIATCVDLVLSRPAQVGGAEIEALVADRLGHPNFFGAGDEKAVRATVAAEMAKFRPDAVKGLASRLAKVVEMEPAGSQLHRHGVAFLGAMAGSATNTPARRHGWDAVGKLLASPGSESVLPILRDDPGGLRSVEPVVRLRALGLVRANLRNPVGQAALSAWLGAEILEEEERKDFLSRIKSEFLLFSTYSRNPDASRDVVAAAAKLVGKIAWSDLWSAYAEWLVAAAASGDFHVENAAIKHLRDLPDHEAGHFTGDQKARAVMHIIRAAEHGAWEGESACKVGLCRRPEFVDAFIEALKAGRLEFTAHQWEWAERVLVNSRTVEVAVDVATSIVTGAIRVDNKDWMVRSMRSSSLREIKALIALGHEAASEDGESAPEPPGST